VRKQGRRATHRAQVEDRRNLLEPNELLARAAKARLGREEGRDRAQIAVEAKRAELQVREKGGVSGARLTGIVTRQAETTHLRHLHSHDEFLPRPDEHLDAHRKEVAVVVVRERALLGGEVNDRKLEAKGRRRKGSRSTHPVALE
jgi:hypothetical protein